MAGKKANGLRIISLCHLRPTQFTVGMLQVKHKRKQLRLFEKRPAELLDFILLHPIRVVLGPAGKAYVIDHHHLGLALLKEKFETAPMEVEKDFSTMPVKAFWKKMEALHFVHLVNAKGDTKPLRDLPDDLNHLKDDPYRSLAGFAREAGAFQKVKAPFAEFLWADYYRTKISPKLVRKHFADALKEAIALSKHKDASKLPGFIKR